MITKSLIGTFIFSIFDHWNHFSSYKKIRGECVFSLSCPCGWTLSLLGPILTLQVSSNLYLTYPNFKKAYKKQILSKKLYGPFPKWGNPPINSLKGKLYIKSLQDCCLCQSYKKSKRDLSKLFFTWDKWHQFVVMSYNFMKL